jgi:hypothetical protein
MHNVTRWSALILLLPLLFSLPACKRKHHTRVQATKEEDAPLATVVHVADPKAVPQLLKGFHEVEQGSWRWTMGKFAVLLRVPDNAAQKKVELQMKFSVPEPVIQKLTSVTLSASVNKVPLAPVTYTKPGEYVFSREVPAQALSGETATVEFTLDKVLAPGAVDTRELGVVASTIGFEWK